MILCEWDAPEGHPGQCTVLYTCVLSYPIVVSHLSFSFPCLLLLYCIYFGGSNCPTRPWMSRLLLDLPIALLYSYFAFSTID
jgi:hypothetical protein